VFLIYGEIKAAEDGTFLRQVAMQIVYSAKFYYLTVPWQPCKAIWWATNWTNMCTRAVRTVTASARLTNLTIKTNYSILDL